MKKTNMRVITVGDRLFVVDGEKIKNDVRYRDVLGGDADGDYAPGDATGAFDDDLEAAIKDEFGCVAELVYDDCDAVVAVNTDGHGSVPANADAIVAFANRWTAQHAEYWRVDAISWFGGGEDHLLVYDLHGSYPGSSTFEYADPEVEGRILSAFARADFTHHAGSCWGAKCDGYYFADRPSDFAPIAEAEVITEDVFTDLFGDAGEEQVGLTPPAGHAARHKKRIMKCIKTYRKIYEVLEDATTVRVVAQCPRGCDSWRRVEGIAPARRTDAKKLVADERNSLVELEESRLDGWLKELTAARQESLARQREAQEAARAKQLAQLTAWLDEAKDEDGVIAASYENVSLLLRWLNAQNWGLWQLPTLSIGYSCNQYATERGGTATTIKLDTPIDTPMGDRRSRFAHGAISAVPRGYTII